MWIPAGKGQVYIYLFSQTIKNHDKRMSEEIGNPRTQHPAISVVYFPPALAVPSV